MNKAGVPSTVLPILLPYALGYFLSYLLRNVNAVITPDLIRELDLRSSDLGLLTSAYLIGFALVQLPLGIALDRLGPRRVESALLVLAALGCAGFGLGHSLTQLTLARGLLGLGMSACLMASFKAFSQSFPLARQASLNASVMIAGGLGAITATTPFSLILPLVGWRNIFFGLAVLALIAALAVRSTPEQPRSAAAEPLADLVKGMGGILASRSFWRFAPQAAVMIGGFIAIQGLWAMPWLLGVNGYSPSRAAVHLLLLNLTLTLGYLLVATRISLVMRRGITLEQLIRWGGTAALLVSLLLIFDVGESRFMWALFGFVCASYNLVYAAHASRYPVQLAGRANACLNLVVFIGSFALQWGFGGMVDLALSCGVSRPRALQLAWGGLFVLEVLSMGWFVASKRWEALTAPS